ncbi:MAG: DUF2267 domain-containing protein [Cyanobacteria bacterium P01_D01_bin.1]
MTTTENSTNQEASANAEISAQDTDFLEKVMKKGNVSSLYEARDITEIVFRTMRDLMTTEAVEEVKEELHTEISAANKTGQEEVADLWKDSNPIVRFLSQVRPKLKFDDDTFLFRVDKEGGVPQTTDSNAERTPPETVVSAVFSATKDELSAEKVAEIADFMPGKIRTLWEEA